MEIISNVAVRLRWFGISLGFLIIFSNFCLGQAKKEVTGKGFFISINASYGLSSIMDENLNNLTVHSDNYEWEPANDYGFLVGLDAKYFITNNFGLGVGINYNTYEADFVLDGNFTSSDSYLDLNFDPFYKNIIASIDSAVNLNYISIPVYLNYTSGKPFKLGFYIDVGVNVSYLISSTYKLTGDYQYQGLYGYYPYINDLELLGFYHRQDIDETGDVDVSSFNISFYASAGLNIPLGYYSSLVIGPEILTGFTDIMSDRSDYKDIFGNITDSKPTKIQKIGLKIAFVYKL